jgi:transcriptional regulator with XRE-family HTH domain
MLAPIRGHHIPVQHTRQQENTRMGKKCGTGDANVDICHRIRQVRAEITGPRGRTAFAQRIHVPTSTYQNYETSRVPPAPVLVRIAEAAGVSLRWLLTGEAEAGAALAAYHPVIRRAAELIGERPNAAAPLAAFLDLLAAALEFPSGAAAEPPPQAEEPAAPQAEPAAALERPAPPPAAPEAADAHAAWIPILGRSAAGVPQFWGEPGDAAGVTMLDELIGRHAARAPARSVPAAAAEQGAGETAAQIVTLTAPAAETAGGPVEFVAAAAIKARFADAFALRVDGESMSPEIRHGDVVILSPSAPAADGRVAVVQLQNQIGVTCKLYRREGQKVHLVPINEGFSPQSFPAAVVVWALRVLARVRPV